VYYGGMVLIEQMQSMYIEIML